MIEPILVPSPSAFPQKCAGCGTQHGPFIDYHVENAAGHLYLCVNLCVKTGARLAGFAEGAKLDELQAASDVVADRERQIDSLTEQLDQAETHMAALTTRCNMLIDTLLQRAARIAQLEEHLRQDVETALSLVGDAAE